MTELTLEQFENIVPTCTIKFENKEIHYHTPNSTTKWRVDSIFTKEPDTIRWLSCMEAGEILVDIGANVGMYSLIAAVGRGIEVFAFEPESQNYSLLNRNVLLNGVQDKVTAYCAALSDKSGMDKFYLGELQAGGSCHSAEQPLDFNLQPLNTKFVQGCILYSLDDLVASQAVPIPTHIKIDVDGFEHKVVAGMMKTLANSTVKSILIELNPNLDEHKELFSVLGDLGYFYFENQVEESQQPDGPFKGIGNVIFYRQGWTAYESVYENQIGSINIEHAIDYMLEKIQSAKIKTDPSPYFFIEDIFPADFYHNLLQNLPKDKCYTSIGDAGLTTGDYNSRSILKINGESLGSLSGIERPFWIKFGVALLSDVLFSALIKKFSDWVPETRFSQTDVSLQREALLIRDKQHYKLGPHTDTHDRVISLLFYLPNDSSLQEEGTAFYKPIDPDFTCRGSSHHQFDGFQEIAKVPFKPNCLLGFVRTDSSFHGVPEFDRGEKNRNLIGYIIRNPARIK